VNVTLPPVGFAVARVGVEMAVGVVETIGKGVAIGWAAV
jgi:hypothetical protein